MDTFDIGAFEPTPSRNRGFSPALVDGYVSDNELFREHAGAALTSTTGFTCYLLHSDMRDTVLKLETRARRSGSR